MQNPQVKHVLFAVDDNNSGAIPFASELRSRFGAELFCESGSASVFAKAGLEAKPVDGTQGAEGVLADMDMLVVDLPDFDETVMSGANFPSCVASIDLSRVALLRAAAKRFAEVAVVSDADEYEGLLQELEDNKGATSYETRIRNAKDAFQLASDYDYDIAEWLAAKLS